MVQLEAASFIEFHAALTGSGQCVWWKSEMCLLRSDFCRVFLFVVCTYAPELLLQYTVTRPCIFHAL